MADVHTVVESYADYLFKKHRRAWAAFQKRRRNARESALAEAMVFRVLQHCDVNPKVADLVTSGGPDFRCADELPSRFMVEATSFLPEKVTRDTALRNEMPEQMTGQAYGRLTTQIDTKATEKLRQFANLTTPGVLAIASNHFGAPLLLDSLAAQSALISDLFWIEDKDGMSTNLESSLFLRLDEGRIKIKNASISAVLFVSVGATHSQVCGALNPEPKHRLETELLYEIPFVYLNDWPVERNKVRLAWTMGNRRQYAIPHASIRKD